VPLVWLLIAIGLAVVEVFTVTFGFIMFAAGALAAAAIAATGAALWVQGLVFAIVSLLALFLVRPAIKRKLDQSTPDAADIGLAAIEGTSCLVLERVDSDHGLVKIDGETWRARSFDGTQAYEPGDRVRVIEVKGATAMVWKD
jgi:membrane protein implicated in regulation of membrane protease activity